MDAKTLIDTLLTNEGMTRYRLSKRLGVNESLLSRAYNGKSDPGFNEISRWLSELGYTLTIESRVNQRLDDTQVFDINHFGKMLSVLDTETYEYLKMHRSLKQVLEACLHDPDPPPVFYYPESIQNKAWRAFYAATIAYLYKSKGRRVPRYSGASMNKIEHEWSPIKKLGRAHTDFDETYKAYNILLPKGELTWI